MADFVRNPASTQDNVSNLEVCGESSIEGGAPEARCICSPEAVEALAERLALRNYSPATIDRYVWALGRFEDFLSVRGIHDLRAVTSAVVEAYLGHLRARGNSPSTRAQALGAVTRLFDSLVKRGLLLVSPCEGVSGISRKHQLPRRVPTVEQMRRLLAAINTTTPTGIRDRAIVEVLYASALRIAELVSLTLDAVDLDNRVLQVLSGKGGKGRVVPMGEAGQLWLSRYLEEARPRWVQRTSGPGVLFWSSRGHPLTGAATRQNLFELSRRAGVPRISPHAIRHASATHLLAAGADIRYVQELLGHAHLSTTQVYTRVAPAEVKATHQRTHPREQGEQGT